MKTAVDEIVERVLVRLDESSEKLEETVEYGECCYDLRNLVRALIPEAAERVLASDVGIETSEWLPLEGSVRRVEGGGYERAVLILPEDFYRFLYLRMSDWAEAETELIASGSDALSLRRYRATRRWSPRSGSPGLTMTYHDGHRAIEIFGSVRGSRVAEGGYLPLPKLNDDGTLLFPPSLSTALVERTVEIIKEIRK